jgi:hypothetical protein
MSKDIRQLLMPADGDKEKAGVPLGTPAFLFARSMIAYFRMPASL